MAFSTPRLVLRLTSNARHVASEPYISEPLKKFNETMSKRIAAYRASGWWHSAIRARMEGADFYGPDGKRYVNMISNCYLMLNTHPRVIAATRKAIEEHKAVGVGISAKLLKTDLQAEAEEVLAKFHQVEEATIFSSLFSGNGFIEATATSKDVIISDAENHASLIFAARLSRAKRLLYKHLNYDDLETKLIEAKKHDPEHTFIVTDGVFSMEGSIVDIIKLRELADKYNAIIVNDDCHAIGVLGKNGRGTDDYYGVKNYSDIVTNSVGKALSGTPGGYIFGSSDFMTYVRHHSRYYMMTTALSVADYATIREAFTVLMEEPEHIQTLRKKIHYMKDGLLSNGIDITGIRDVGVFAVVIGQELAASEVQRSLIREGIACTYARFPGVARGQARLRLNVNAKISQTDMDKFIEAIVKVRKERGGFPEIVGDAIPVKRGDPAKRLVSEVITMNLE